MLEDQLGLYGGGPVSREDGPAIAIPETADALQAAIEQVLNAIFMKILNPNLREIAAQYNITEDQLMQSIIEHWK